MDLKVDFREDTLIKERETLKKNSRRKKKEEVFTYGCVYRIVSFLMYYTHVSHATDH